MGGINAGSRFRGAAVGIVAAVMLCLAGCQPVQTREDFKGAVINKSPAEVENHLGKPDSIDNSNPSVIVWVYKGMTFDMENNNKRDPSARVIFGRQNAAGSESVIDVNFGS